MTQSIAVYGGSFSPPGLHHRQIVEHLAEQFDRVIVVPCGPRPDKPSNDDLAPIYRAAMTDIAFAGMPRVEVDLFDLEQATFTRTHDLQRRYESRGEVWHVVGGDLISGGRKGESFIHRHWQHGPELWKALRFAVVERGHQSLAAEDLPPQHRLFRTGLDGSSYALRERLFRGEPIDALVPPRIASYIERHGLYRGRMPMRTSEKVLSDPRLMIYFDERNPRARDFARHFRPFEVTDSPNCIVVIGGDGTMLHCIQQHWRKRIMFLGVNAGHLGFLLNNAKDVIDGKFPPGNIVLRQMPLLYIRMRRPDGSTQDALSFNDAWVERSTGQSAWIKVTVDGRERMEKVVCDGALVSTAAGSTAYAQSMGAKPLLADTPAWMLVGSNVMTPAGWKSALLPFDAEVEIESLDNSKRPLNGFVHGTPMGQVTSMYARMSRIASAELAFMANHDLAEKIAQIQFPQSGGSLSA